MSVITMSYVNTQPKSHQLCKCSSDDSLGSDFKYNLTKVNAFEWCVTKQCANYQLLFSLTRSSTADGAFKE